MKRFLTFFILTTALACAIDRGDRMDFTLNDGVVLKNAKIIEVTPTELLVINSEGITTIKKSSLPEKIATQVNWPPVPVKPTPPPLPPIPIATTKPARINQSQAPFIPDATPPAAPRLQLSALMKIKPDQSPLTPYDGGADTTLLSSTLSGQCFVVTKGGNNVKLGLVPIFLYPRGMYYHYLGQILERKAAYRKQTQPYLDQFDAEKDTSNWLSAYNIIKFSNRVLDELMPTPVKKTYTDADGKFEVTHNLNAFNLVAKGDRQVGETKEEYSWEIPSEKIEKDVPLFLSNQNMD